MNKKIYLAFLWHHHQPYYRLASAVEPVYGRFQMPWVRLHGIKDYYGMASLIKDFPKIKSNINLVPSLLKQIKEYIAGDKDRLLFLTMQSVSDLTDSDKQYILENAFLAHAQYMIGVYPRYKELYSKINHAGGTPYGASINGVVPSGTRTNQGRFSDQDFIDLLIYSSLVWFHPLIMERDTELKALRQKGRNYTEDDKKLIVHKQLSYLSEIIPLHKKLQEDGQIEITTTPFYHPILPLLCNMQSAREAMPDVPLPMVDQSGLLEDARWQVAEAVRFYKEHFGAAVKGLWPAEGSVSPDILPLLAEHGINYLASDEEILARTLNSRFTRDSNAILQNPQDLYQPYRIQNNLSIIFRDQHLSDLIGFQYKTWNPDDAAAHFISQIKSNAHKVSGKPPLVSVILDGENPWEHYPNNGIEFLRGLYERLSADDEIETVRISDYLSNQPPERKLESIYSGSWINHNFAIWIGHKEDRQAWEYIARTKEAVKTSRATLFPNEDTQAGLQRDPDAMPQKAGSFGTDERYNEIQENIYIAEGSDWFWWFGHEHSSALDDQFDALFRKHLINVYELLGLNIPEYLHHQIKERRSKKLYTQPWGLLSIKLDGRRSDYFEWLAAGHFEVSANYPQSTTMDSSSSPEGQGKDLISHIFFGFDDKNFCLRLDLTIERSKTQRIRILRDDIYFILNFLKPLKRNIIIHNSNSSFTILDEDNKPLKEDLETIAVDEIIEIICPLDILGFKKGNEIEFFLEVYQYSSELGACLTARQVGSREHSESRETRGKLLARYPDSQPIGLIVPVEDLEYINWMA